MLGNEMNVFLKWSIEIYITLNLSYNYISTSEREIKDVSRGGVVLVFWVRRSDPTNVTFSMNFQTMEDVEDK